MATVLLAASPLHGHVAPVIEVGRCLAPAHRVVMVTGARFRPRVEAAGLEFRPLAGRADFDERELDSFLPDRDRHRGVALSQYQLQQTFIHPMVDQWSAVRAALESTSADLVMADQLFAGVTPLLARSREARPAVVGVGIGPLGQLSRDVPPGGMALPPSPRPWGRLRNVALNTVATRVVFRDSQRLARRLYREATGEALPSDFPFILDLTRLFDRFLQLGPREFEYPRSDLAPGVRFVGPLPLPAAAGEFPPWWDDLDDGRPIVHVTQGTLANADPTELLVPALQGLAGFDGHVVASTGGLPVDALGALPANARVAPFLPYDRLIPRLSALVTNGGYGTVLLALANGVPVVVAPGAEDKPEVAARVRYFGVGENLRTGRPTPEQVKAAVARVLTSGSIHARTQMLAGAIATYDSSALVRAEVEAVLAAR